MYNRKVITSTQFNRPDYTRQMLNCLSKCKGIEDYLVLFSIDGNNEEVINLCGSFDFCDRILSINKEKLGCNLNTKAAISSGFLHSDFVIHVEDDVLLSKRSLEIFEILAEETKNLDYIFSISLYNRLGFSDVNINDKNLVLKRPSFVPWGFGLWKNRFEQVSHCFSNGKTYEDYLSWDCQIDRFHSVNKMFSVFTKFSRVDNIGALNGVHVPNAEWHEKNHKVPFGAWMVNDDFEYLNIQI